MKKIVGLLSNLFAIVLILAIFIGVVVGLFALAVTDPLTR